LQFRNESQLPLRLGLVIDTSDSVTDRFRFEQAAAIKFLQRVVRDENDLSFVVGVNNSVLLVQDFTSDLHLMTKAVDELAPGGGTAVWDAVSFALEKLSARPETQPVARVLVVISDGEDNSSGVSLKEAIQQAQRGEVAVYTICTRDFGDDAQPSKTGEHALRTFSDLTGGAVFVPGSIRRLDSIFAELQQVIRGRYLVSYKPASFERNGRYRAIDITAAKDGHKLRVYARRGYYAASTHPRTPQADVTQ
jgi:VWFA-related protein